MNSKFSFLSLLLLVLFSTQISYANNSTEALARKAVSVNVAEAAPALEELRTLGPAGLKALMDQYRDEIVKRWGPRAVVSLAFAIATARLYPTVKYAMGHGKACARIVVDGAPISFVKAATAAHRG